MKDITEAVIEAEEEILSKTEEWAEAMKSIMENTFSEAAYNMEMAMTQSMGFDALNGSLERLNAYQEIYLTTTNEIYELSKMMRNAQQAADKTDNASAKKKLSTYMKEIETLKNDGIPLSKLELELAQARYEVLLAEIALEEAQNTKSTVRLQRDNEGNFGYVYTSDGEAILQAEQDLADAQNKLYNIGLEAANDYGQKMLELQQKFYEDWNQLQQNHANGMYQSEEEYQQAKALLMNEYTTALGVDANIQQEAWITAYDNMIDQTQNWQEHATQATLLCEQAYNEWRVAVTQHNDLIQDVLTNTKGKVDEVVSASNELKDKVIREVIPAISSELKQVDALTTAYAHQRDAIFGLISYYENLINQIERAIAAQARLQMEQSKPISYDVSGIKDFSQAMADHLSNGGSTSDGWYQALVEGRNEKIQQKEYAQYGGEDAINMQTLMAKYEKYKIQGIENGLTQYVEDIDKSNQKYFDPDQIKKLISSFASGGYTGAWGPSGRLAVLHQKELVLNASDTLHFLQAAEILRGVSEAIDLQAMANQVDLTPYTGILSNGLAEQALQQQVTIEANFPGVQDRFEIEEAFNNLINTASQYANRK